MRRDPTIHITVSSLIKILTDLKMHSPEWAAQQIFKGAKPYQLRNRYQVKVANSRMKKAADKSIDADTKVVEKFAGILASVRLELKHRNIRPVGKGDRDYIMLKEIAQTAQEFVQEFKIIPVEEGYKMFCHLGITMMGKVYGLNKFKTYSDKIFNMYEALDIVGNDDKPGQTKTMFQYWQTKMSEHTTMTIEVPTDKYANFVYARKQADELKADYQDWIDGQFSGLAFLDAIPEVTQLHGENAKGRYVKYMINAKGKKIKQDTEVYASEEEKKYWESLK